MGDLVYKETCSCGGSIEITTEISNSLFDRKDRINEFVNKHRTCAEIRAANFPSMPASLASRSVDPDEELNNMELAILEQILRDIDPNKVFDDRSIKDIVDRLKNAGFKITRMY